MASYNTPWYKYRIARWKHFGGIPLSRLWMLLLAAALLFSIFGFYFDLIDQGTIPYAAVFIIAGVSSVNAVLWILTVARLPAVFLTGMIALQFFIGAISTFAGNWTVRTFHLHSVPRDQGIHFAANCILFVSMASYFFFTTFIRTQGKRSLLIQNELETAHDMQRTLVPTVEIRTPRFEVYGISQPSEMVGGDLVDAVSLSNGDLVAFLADVTGHGLSASILMGRLKTAVRTALLDAGECEPRTTMPLLLHRLNTVLPQVKEPTTFATFTGFRLDANGNIFCALAASPPIVQWHASAQSISQFEEPQFPVGLFPVSQFEGFSLDAAPGDLFIVATDGILEVADKSGEEFGIERLNNIIAAAPHDPLPQLAARILAAARSFGRQLDDQTLLLVRCL